MLISQKSVAGMLGVSTGTLAQWRVRGYGPAFVKVGHFVRYSPQAIERFIADNSRQSTKRDQPSDGPTAIPMGPKETGR